MHLAITYNKESTYYFLSTPEHTKLSKTNMKRRTHEAPIFLLNNDNIESSRESGGVYLTIKSFHARNEPSKIAHTADISTNYVSLSFINSVSYVFFLSNPQNSSPLLYTMHHAQPILTVCLDRCAKTRSREDWGYFFSGTKYSFMSVRIIQKISPWNKINLYKLIVVLNLLWVMP